MPRALSLLLVGISPLLITGGTLAFALFVNAARVDFGSKRPGWPILVAGIGLWLLHIGFLLAPWLWVRGRTTLGLWLTCPVGLLALCFWLFFLGRLVYADPVANPDLAHKFLWSLGLVGGLAAYAGPIVVLLLARETWLHRLASSPYFAAVMAVGLNLAGLAASFFLIVMLLAGGANSTPAQLTTLKQLMLAVSIIGLGGLAGGIWAFVAGRHWLSAALGAVPATFVIILVTVLLKQKF